MTCSFLLFSSKPIQDNRLYSANFLEPVVGCFATYWLKNVKIGKIREYLIIHILFCFCFLLCRSYSGTILGKALKKMPLSFPSSRPLYCSILPPTQPPKKGIHPRSRSLSSRPPRGEEGSSGERKRGPRSSLFSPLAASGAAKGGSRGKKAPSAPFKPATASVGRSYLLREKTKETRWFLGLLKKRKKQWKENPEKSSSPHKLGRLDNRGNKWKKREAQTAARSLASYCPVKDSPRIV